MPAIKFTVIILISITSIYHTTAIKPGTNPDMKVEDNKSSESQQKEDSEPGSIQIISKPAKSSRPSEEERIHIQVDCLIVDIFTGLKMDRETTAVAENLLGKVKKREQGKSPAPISSSADIFLKKTIEATALIKDTSTEDNRVTQEQLMTLVEMLASRGFLRIQANPTLQVVNGKTAKIQTKQSSIQITPRLLEGGDIELKVQVVPGSPSIPEGKEQILNSTEREISTRIRVSPGESSIIGGIKTIRKSSEAKNNAENFEEHMIETLLILTPKTTYRWLNGKVVDGFGREVDLKTLKTQSLVGKALPELTKFNLRLDPKWIENKMLLICFWDMNQRPSRNYIIQLNKKARELQAKDIAVVAIQASKIEHEKLDGWIKENNITFPVALVDAGGELICFNWGVQSLAWLILTDKQHTVRAEGFNINELDGKIKALREK